MNTDNIMVTKIIFLDVDGVLNFPRMEDKIQTRSGRVSESRVKLLNQLTEETGAKLVLSSTWRLDGVAALDNLKSAGITGEFIGMTGRGCNCCLRGNEVLKWIKDNQDIIGCRYDKYRNYVILDDDSDMLYWQKDNYVYCDNWVGITPNTVYRAEKILNQ